MAYLSELPFDEIVMGLNVVNIHGKKGKIVDKERNGTMIGNLIRDTVTIEWDNNRKSLLIHELCDLVEVIN